LVLFLFKKIREVFSRFIDQASQILVSKNKLMDLVEDFKLELVSNDVAYDAAQDIVDKVVEAIDKNIVRDSSSLKNFMRSVIRSYFNDLEYFDIFGEARSYKPYKIVFLGINGVGKTTTIAKIAYMYKERGYNPLMVAADTFRAGAQEQLKIHGDRIGVRVFGGKYGSDPAAVAYDAINHASSHGYNVVLIDTAGRMHSDVDLVGELAKIIRVSKPHRKILVVDALTGNDAVDQARFFNESVGVDGVVVTKVDAYERGGVPLSIVYAIRKPIIMIGVGQGYGDLRVFNVDDFLDKIIS